MGYEDLTGATVIGWYEDEEMQNVFLGRRVVSAEIKRQYRHDDQGWAF